MVDVKIQEYKGYNLGLTGEFALIRIKAKGQGKIPNQLKGLYTSFKSAENAVDSYLNSLKKGANYGKAKKTKGPLTS